MKTVEIRDIIGGLEHISDFKFYIESANFILAASVTSGHKNSLGIAGAHNWSSVLTWATPIHIATTLCVLFAANFIAYPVGVYLSKTISLLIDDLIELSIELSCKMFGLDQKQENNQDKNKYSVYYIKKDNLETIALRDNNVVAMNILTAYNKTSARNVYFFGRIYVFAFLAYTEITCYFGIIHINQPLLITNDMLFLGIWLAICAIVRLIVRNDDESYIYSPVANQLFVQTLNHRETPIFDSQNTYVRSDVEAPLYMPPIKKPISGPQPPANT